MDNARFDALSRSLFASPSRRTALRLLAGLALGSAVGWRHSEEGAAHDKRKQCKKREGQAKKKCLKKAKKHQARHTTSSCPPVCPVCQGCNATSGLCEAHPGQQGLPAPGCAVPQVCCSGACCDPPNHFCNSAGACATCAEVCPDNCDACFSLADGGTQCGDSFAASCTDTCTTTADCSDGKVCATSLTIRSDNTFLAICGGGGTCATLATTCS